MKKTLLTLPVLALAGCMETGMSEGMEGAVITDEAQFLQLIGDRQVHLKGERANNLVIGVDGSITGTFGGANLAGSWEWRDGAWCRTLTEGPRGPSPEDCQQWTINADGDFDVSRNRGQGASFTYVLS